jgi:hypothetical protein
MAPPTRRSTEWAEGSVQGVVRELLRFAFGSTDGSCARRFCGSAPAPANLGFFERAGY